MNRFTIFVVTCAVCLPLQAATVNFVGSTSGTGVATGEAAQWRTAAVAKTYDSDSDNLYGSAGYFTVSPNNPGGSRIAIAGTELESQVTGLSLATAAPSTITGDFSGQDNFDNPLAAGDINAPYFGQDFGANTTSGGLVTILTYTVLNASQLGGGLRLGVLMDVNNGESGGVDDRATADALAVRINGSLTSAATLLTADGLMDGYFYDVASLANGDTIEILASAGVPSNANAFNANGISAVTFDLQPVDLQPVPEPGTLLLAMLGIFSVTLCSRCGQKRRST